MPWLWRPILKRQKQIFPSSRLSPAIWKIISTTQVRVLSRCEKEENRSFPLSDYNGVIVASLVAIMRML